MEQIDSVVFTDLLLTAHQTPLWVIENHLIRTNSSFTILSLFEQRSNPFLFIYQKACCTLTNPRPFQFTVGRHQPCYCTSHSFPPRFPNFLTTTPFPRFPSPPPPLPHLFSLDDKTEPLFPNLTSRRSLFNPFIFSACSSKLALID